MLCTISDCGNRVASKGLCSKHYARQRRNGTTDAGNHAHMSAKDRFWHYAKPANGCWAWTGHTSFGYGVFYVKRERHTAHRFSYELYKGSIPAGMHIRHTCDNPPCCNPDHLLVGTARDNAQDREQRGRGNQRAMRGSFNGNSSITEEQARHILTSSERGVDLARRYGIAPCTVSAIRKRRLWAHLEV